MSAFGRLGLATLTLALVACTQAIGNAPTPMPASPTPSPAPSAAPVGLDGRQFLSTSVKADGVPFALVAGTRVRITFFANGSLSAQAGCNTIGGNYSIDGNRLIFSGGSMTEMGCDAARSAQDNWLAAVFGSGLTFALNGSDLTLTSGTTAIILHDREVAEPDQPLSGVVWTLSSFITGDVASSVPIGINATIAFADDGTFALNDGCNSGGGRYVVDGDTIRFSEVAMTEMACAGAAGQVEQAVLAVLGADSITLAIDANSLTFQAGIDGLQFTSVNQL